MTGPSTLICKQAQSWAPSLLSHMAFGDQVQEEQMLCNLKLEDSAPFGAQMGPLCRPKELDIACAFQSELRLAPTLPITGLPSKVLETVCDFFTPFLARGSALVAYCIRHHLSAHQRQHSTLGKPDLGLQLDTLRVFSIT